MSKYHFFWSGPFSQWATSHFEINGNKYNCCEQYMMREKALLFADTEIAEKIMATNNPREQKALGRKVRGYVDETWMVVAYDVVVRGNMAKFTQNPHLMKELEATKGQLLVEASPYDKRWGIGLGVDHPDIDDPSKWRGENLLGQAITEVRIELLGE